MEPLRGWAQRGERLVAKVPHGRWKPCTHRYEAGARGTLTKAGAFSGAASGLESGMNSRLFIAGVGEVVGAFLVGVGSEELADGGEEAAPNCPLAISPLPITHHGHFTSASKRGLVYITTRFPVPHRGRTATRSPQQSKN